MRRWLVGGLGVLLVVAAAVCVTPEEWSIPPLPPSAGPVPDRVPTEDVTGDASTSAVLSAPLPRRDKPVPYVRQGVPAAQEYRGAIVGEAVPESTAPVTGTPRPAAPISGSGGK